MAAQERFKEIIDDGSPLLFEGAIVERLKRSKGVRLDPKSVHAELIYQEEGRSALKKIYRQYIDIAQAHSLPMALMTPTWRANRAYLAGKNKSAEEINKDNVVFLRELASPFRADLFIGGLLGCRGDAYRPEEALSASDAKQFHAEQIGFLAAGGVDFLIAPTLPALSEAAGMASAMAQTRLPYIISFVLNPAGDLLDGTPLIQAINKIDGSVSPAPTAYMANCTHPSAVENLLSKTEAPNPLLVRLKGIQGNTSKKPPHELDNAKNLESQDPESFSEATLRLRRRFGLNALGGCCGTDHQHIAAIAKGFKE